MPYLLTERPLLSYMAPGVLLSVIAHALFFLLLFYHRPSSPLERSALVEPVMVSFVPPPIREDPQPQRQIVSPSESNENAPLPNEAFLSEKDSAVLKQQIKRGDAPDAGSAVSRQPSTAAAASALATMRDSKTEPQKNTTKETTKSDNPKPARGANPKLPAEKLTQGELRLDTETLLKEFGQAKAVSTEDRLKAAIAGQSDSSPTASINQIQPFSRVSGSGARFLGTQGNSDYIPTLPDGDITMLNAKANQYAVFVRRVALQVFGNLRSSGWERLQAKDVHAMSDESTVTAVLSKRGELLEVKIEKESGSRRFDEVLSAAVKAGAHDPNPPAAAALDDGNIHFIFKARCWVQIMANPRSGFPSEHRWLVLGTGLQ